MVSMAGRMRQLSREVNLIPREVQRSLALRYYMSLATMFFFLAAIAIGLGALLLVPSYLLAKNTVESSARYRAALEDTLGLKEKAGVTDAMSALGERVSVLASYDAAPRTALALAAVGRDLPEGVSVTKMSLQITDTGAGTITVAGVAKARGALVSFVDALRADPLFQSVSIPVNQLATDTDIPFSLSFALVKP